METCSRTHKTGSHGCTVVVLPRVPVVVAGWRDWWRAWRLDTTVCRICSYCSSRVSGWMGFLYCTVDLTPREIETKAVTTTRTNDGPIKGMSDFEPFEEQ
jgi:hypothetical protein